MGGVAVRGGAWRCVAVHGGAAVGVAVRVAVSECGSGIAVGGAWLRG